MGFMNWLKGRASRLGMRRNVGAEFNTSKLPQNAMGQMMRMRMTGMGGMQQPNNQMGGLANAAGQFYGQQGMQPQTQASPYMRQMPGGIPPGQVQGGIQPGQPQGGQQQMNPQQWQQMYQQMIASGMQLPPFDQWLQSMMPMNQNFGNQQF